ncbi:Uncharacterized membrane protein YphA, DoxX/SURF4 family [Pseudoxanthomonas wuyuanensis]|uniref:Uncharacterized membrane protein YphA, DoxX/SURF4 family n=2 Tax=Pseudoxanthomonas wuyuanensis TaxID=1073196 RepID=A0A286D2Y3_9GAMM|nr:Uncharacterized membrane protein YphA, DoxX/SURF4 family [Pseudoxanthomonas wuyuanensis]
MCSGGDDLPMISASATSLPRGRQRMEWWEDLALAALRVLVGGFLVWGVADNIASAERMSEFAAFLAYHRFPYPSLLAPLSVWVQCLCGLAFISGLGFRTAGIFCAANFIVAVAMVDAHAGIRAAFPASVLAMLGFYFSARGPGRYALGRRRRQEDGGVSGPGNPASP